MADAVLADKLASKLTFDPAIKQATNALERVPSEIITKIIKCFASGDTVHPHSVGPQTPLQVLNHKTLMSLSLTSKRLHILAEPFLYAIVRPWSDARTWQQCGRRLENSANASSDRSRFRHAQVLATAAHMTDIELLDSLCTVMTNLRQLHLTVEVISSEKLTVKLLKLFAFSSAATATLSRVTRLNIDLRFLTAGFRHIYLRTITRYFAKLQVLEIHGTATADSALGLPRVIKDRTSVEYLLLDIDTPDVGQPSFKASLECIDTATVETLVLVWHHTLASDSLTLGDNSGKSWRNLRAVHLMGHEYDISHINVSYHEVTAQILTFLAGQKQVHTVRFEGTFMASAYFDTVSSLLTALRPSITTLELGWPCPQALLALDHLCGQGRLFTSSLAGVRTVRFVNLYAKQPGEADQYNAKYLRIMMELFDSFTIRRWLGGNLKRLSDRFQAQGRKVEPTSFWTDLGTNLGRMLDDTFSQDVTCRL